MKIFLFSFILTFALNANSQDLISITFRTNDGQCNLNCNYLKMPRQPITRLRLRINPTEKRLYRYEWLDRFFTYKFVLNGIEPVFIKQDNKTKLIVWEIPVKELKLRII